MKTQNISITFAMLLAFCVVLGVSNAWAQAPIGVEISANSNVFYMGDTFQLNVKYWNNTAQDVPVQLYVALEFQGQFFFYPHFREWAAPADEFVLQAGATSQPTELFSVKFDSAFPSSMTFNWYAVLIDTSTVQAAGDISSTSTLMDPHIFPRENNAFILSGTIVNSVTLKAEHTWVLRGGVFIGNDVDETILNIEPGTVIHGEKATNGFLVIRRGSKLIAEGTKEEPIVFTSSLPKGQRARGDWGGLILNGRAPLNTGDEAFGEGGTGYYGGNDPTDNSGILRYVRVEFAGRIISPDNELNGIAFQGVGSGTTVEYIQVHMNKDDGVEFFGGTCNIKHALVTGVADDSLDWTDGWGGKAQFVVLQQYEDTSDNGIEADNNGENNTATPRSHPTISNITIIGSPNSTKSDIGILVRAGTAANIHNAIVTGFNDAGLDIDDSETFANAYTDFASGTLTGELTIENSIIYCDPNDNFKDGETDDPVMVSDFFLSHNLNNTVTDPLLLYDPLNPPTAGEMPDFRPQSNSPALNAASVPSDPFFDQVSFLGGINPSDNWIEDWTTHDRN